MTHASFYTDILRKECRSASFSKRMDIATLWNSVCTGTLSLRKLEQLRSRNLALTSKGVSVNWVVIASSGMNLKLRQFAKITYLDFVPMDPTVRQFM